MSKMKPSKTKLGEYIGQNQVRKDTNPFKMDEEMVPDKCR